MVGLNVINSEINSRLRALISLSRSAGEGEGEGKSVGNTLTSDPLPLKRARRCIRELICRARSNFTGLLKIVHSACIPIQNFFLR